MGWNRGALILHYSNQQWAGSGTDNNGNLKKADIYIPGDDAISTSSLWTDYYTYDSLNRLTSMYEQNGGANPFGQGYSYDNWGNRQINQSSSVTWGGVPAPTSTIDTNTNRMTMIGGVGRNFDQSGNMTTGDNSTSNSFDAENRITQNYLTSNPSVQYGVYTYDGDGKRVRRTNSSGTVWQIYGMDGTLIAEYAANAAPSAPTKEYGYRNGQMLISAESNSTVKWLVADQLGTPRMLIDKLGTLSSVERHDYLPFGEELTAGFDGRGSGNGYVNDTVKQKFTSKERDVETGLDFFEARYYASSQGRFISADDFLNDTKTIAPQSWNLYVYVRNNPLRYTDPSGEEIYNTNLSVEEQKKLLDDWKNKTGYKNIYFDKNNKLTIDKDAGFEGGSATARKVLLDAATTTEKVFNLQSVDSKEVGFAHVDAGTVNLNTQTKVSVTVFNIQIDFKDFDRLRGDKDAIAAFSVGVAALHEIAHKLYGDLSDSPNGSTDPGPVENNYINPIRRELGLAERSNYVAQKVPAPFDNAYNHNGRQLNFKLNGKDKVLRWQHDQVGGKESGH